MAMLRLMKAALVLACVAAAACALPEPPVSPLMMIEVREPTRLEGAALELSGACVGRRFSLRIADRYLAPENRLGVSVRYGARARSYPSSSELGVLLAKPAGTNQLLLRCGKGSDVGRVYVEVITVLYTGAYTLARVRFSPELDVVISPSRPLTPEEFAHRFAP
jgi:hypothetical protein